MSELKGPWKGLTKADREYILDQLDGFLQSLVPRMTREQILSIVNDHLDQAEQDYQDFLSRPEEISDDT